MIWKEQQKKTKTLHQACRVVWGFCRTGFGMLYSRASQIYFGTAFETKNK
jgi:hypothetical protein